MSQLDPTNTSVGDICLAALKDSGAIGVGMTPLAEDISDAQARLQWMLQQWERKRWLVYHLVTYTLTSTGQQTYTIGPTPPAPLAPADIDLGLGTARPANLAGAALRQLVSALPVDIPLEIIQSKEDYLRVTLKKLTSFTGAVYYEPDWPFGIIYPVPIPQANLYALVLTFLEQLPTSFASVATTFNLPYEYFAAMVANLAIRLRPKYGLGSYPGDPLPGMAKDSLETIRGVNSQIARLTMPGALLRPGIYNIFSDRSY